MPRQLLSLALGALTILSAGPAASATLKDYRQLVLDGHKLKWGAPVLGRGATVTYALATQAMDFVGARNCKGLAPIGNLLVASGVEVAVFREELAAAFAGWQAVADITFRETGPETADIIVGAEVEPLGRAFTNVVYDETATTTGPRRLSQSVICLNPVERWKVGFDGNLSRYDLRYTLLHEIGHAIGLDHPAGRDAVMDFAYRERFRVLQPGDIEGVIGLYGPAQPAAEPPVVAIGAAGDRTAPMIVAR